MHNLLFKKYIKFISIFIVYILLMNQLIYWLDYFIYPYNLESLFSYCKGFNVKEIVIKLEIKLLWIYLKNSELYYISLEKSTKSW